VTIRLLLADDQALVRGALASLLDLETDMEVVVEVGRGDEVMAAAKEFLPDVALLDVEMPGLDGIEAARELRSALPDLKVLIVTTFGRPGYLRRALQAGASGFVVKDTPARQLADEQLAERIEEIFDASRGTYGWPRVHKALRDEGVHASGKRVARVMRRPGPGR